MDTSLPSGEYRNNVIISAIASPVPKPSDISAISTMQEMTMEICENMGTGVSKSLKDTRNGKYYTVAKEKDGNCWMRTNLAIAGTVPKAKVTGGTDGSYTLLSGSTYWDKNNAYGLYYTFAGVTAGTGGTSQYTNALASICPTGGDDDANWVLPKSGERGGYYSWIGSFAYLLNASGGQTLEVVNTLGFQRGGNIVNGGVLGGDGDTGTGNYWSRTYAYIMSFSSDGYIFPSNDVRSFSSSGFSARCLYPSISTKSSVQTQ